MKDTFRRLDLHFPIMTFKDFVTFFTLEDTQNLTSTFRNDLIFNAVYAIHSEFHDLMHSWDKLTHRSDFEDYLEKRLSRLVHLYNKYNHNSLISLPQTAQDIAFRSHAKGNSDPTKSALQVRYRYLQPHMDANLSNLSTQNEKAFNHTWTKHSVLAKIVSRQIHFLPLPVPPDTSAR